LDAPCIRDASGLTADQHWAHLRRVPDVRTTAELNGKWSTNFNHAHIVTIVFTKECHRTHCLGFFQRSLNGVDGKVRIHCLVSNQCNLFQLCTRQLFGEVEVKSQVNWTVQRTCLHSCWT